MFIDFDREGTVKGLGIDILYVHRLSSLNPEQLEKLAMKILNGTEYEKFEADKRKALRLGVFFSAKESVSKALGCGFNGIGFKDICIDYDSMGRGIVLLTEKAAKIAYEKNISGIKLSVSHEKDIIITQAIAT